MESFKQSHNEWFVWVKKGKINVWHRENGYPAYGDNFAHSFYENDELHRYNGPATIGEEMTGYDQYWCIQGIEIEAIDYFSWLEDNGIDINNISDTDKILIAMRWNQ